MFLDQVYFYPCRENFRLRHQTKKVGGDMHKQRLGIVIAAAVGMLGTFLPWFTVPLLGSINGTKGDGWISLVLFLVALLMGLLGDKTNFIQGGKLYLAMITAGLGSVIGVYEIIDFNDKISGAGAFGKAASIGFGIYVIILAGIAVIAVGISMKK